MEKQVQHVSLGFTDQMVPKGTHMCLIFRDEQERINSLLAFLLSGLQTGEKTTCFSESVSEPSIRKFLSDNNISYDERKHTEAISLHGTSEVYFEGGIFDPERMLNSIIDFYNQSETQGFKATRIIGEMTPEVENVPGGERLLVYECKVSILLREHPVTIVCLYDARSFDGATIMDVLKVHPQMMVNGAVVKNPFFIEPEEYLKHITN